MADEGAAINSSVKARYELDSLLVVANFNTREYTRYFSYLVAL